ncbi:MAG: hypothetical protein K2K47_09215 [Duncaniella sp.]|nr:hypothetical protein [Duncaniella sp.]
MKKFLYLLLALPVLGLLASCDDDNSLPQVTVQVDYEGAVDVDGVLYVVQGEPFSITSVKVTPDEGTGNATLGPVNYAWNSVFIGTSEVAPYGVGFDTENMNLGNHLLEMSATIVQVNKPLSTLNLGFKIKVVASAEDIPGNGDDTVEGGSIVTTVNTAH